MIISVLSIVILALIVILVLLFGFLLFVSKKYIEVTEVLETASKCYDKIIPLYDKYRAAETDADKVKFVKAILDVAQDTNNEYYRKLEEYKKKIIINNKIMSNVYIIKTNIKVKNNNFLMVNVVAEDLSEAITNASYLKYNGEELKKHIISVEVLVQNVLNNTWNIKDLNPDYKGEDKTYTDEDGNPLPTVG